MNILRLAIDTGRWDLAACALILVALRLLETEVTTHDVPQKNEVKPQN
jgi:hypothetical protein